MDKSLKIIIFDGSFKATTFINRLARGLNNSHEVYILGFNETISNKIAGVKYVPLGSNQNFFRFVTVSLNYAFQGGLLFKSLCYLFKRNRKALQAQNLDIALNRINPDLIHLQWLSNIALFEPYLEQGDYKFVLSQRGFHVNIRPFVNETNMAYLRKWFPKFHGFHSVSKAIRSVSDSIYSHPLKIDKVVYSGLDYSALPELKLNERSDSTLKLLSVGRDHWIKGYSYALKAISILKEKGVSVEYRIIGINKPSEELLFLIHEYGIEKQVEFVSNLSEAEVYKKMQSSNLLLMPSIEEGIANVCIEAMAVGLPVLSTNCGGMEELISHNKTGFIVPVRDPKAIAEAVKAFLELETNRLNEIRLAARKKVEEQHVLKGMINQIKSLYWEAYADN